jgi:putative glutamine amidotransferase
MSRPLIGITVSGGRSASDLPTATLHTAYIQAVVRAGGLPLLIPNEIGPEGWLELFPRFGGVLFTGGGDIRPSLLDEAEHPAVTEVDDSRDALELPLLRAVVSDGKPFLGICRGLQVANVALGGTLYTHLSDQLSGALEHDRQQGFPRSYLAHPVRLDEDTTLAEILAEPMLRVNSLHHQGIKGLAADLKPAAYAPDGLVEAVELPGHPFGLAVQWHPEWLTDQYPMRRLFSAFVEAAAR